ncbi:MAG: hypothetical protein AAF827_00945 [Cyanobacteria bacterium P01_D01_bin.6]
MYSPDDWKQAKEMASRMSKQDKVDNWRQVTKLYKRDYPKSFLDKVMHRYSSVKGCTKWSEIALYALAVAKANELIPSYKIDWTTHTQTIAVNAILNEPIPCYAIKPELADAFNETDLSDSMPMIQRDLRHRLIMLPRSSFFIDPEGIRAIAAFVTHLSMSERIEESLYVKSLGITHIYGQKELEPSSILGDNIAVTLFSESGESYSSLFNIRDGNVIFNSPEIGGLNENLSVNETNWLHHVAGIIYQALLYAQQITPIEVSEPKSKGFGKASKEKDGFSSLRPRLIGADYVIKKIISSNDASGGTHASPRTHWRRGHYRRVAIGEGRNERKTVWIEPTLVNG